MSAVTGYVTNAIAVRMLFRPRAPWRLWGLSFQGLIPKRRAQIAESVAETIERHLISHDDIKRALDDPQVEQRLRGVLDERIETMLRQELKTVHPLAGIFVSEKVIAKVKALVMREALQAAGPITEQMLDLLEEKMDFRQLIIAKIEQFDLDRFEQIIMRISSRELRAIEWLGGVMGLIIGLITAAIMLLFS
ncbi:MAG: DUF445 family protein [Candidatus Sumerlaeota bacterium]|nr:DUF445 family protein [Candidatus Sumerlaeota bacterium]